MEYIYQIDPKTLKRVGKISRDVAHNTGKLHEVIHCWIINDKGQVLLQYRSKLKSHYASCYHVAIAGHVEYGQSSEETVIKEAQEELGIELDPDKLVYLFDMKEKLIVPEDGSTDFEYRKIWAYKISEEKFGKLQSEETESIVWFDIKELMQDIREGDFYSKMLQNAKSYYLKALSELVGVV